MTIFPIAEALAADLAGAGVDPNEAQKAMAYLRSRRSGKAFFDYLQAVVNNGQVVIRSRQTLDYYRAIQQACQRHLRPLQNDYRQMALTLGWALRLLRYYRAVPDAAREKIAQQRATPPPTVTPQPPQQQPAPPSVQAQLVTPSTPVEAPPHPTEKQYPTLFTGKVVDGDDNVFIIQVPGFSAGEAIAVLKIEPGVPKYRIGKDSAKVEVTGIRKVKSGKTILEVRRPA